MTWVCFWRYVAFEVRTLVVIIPPPDLIDIGTQGLLVQVDEELKVVCGGRPKSDPIRSLKPPFAVEATQVAGHHPSELLVSVGN